MNNHFHLLLEVPRMKDGGLTDTELLKCLSAIYHEAFVAGVAKELAEARQQVADGVVTRKTTRKGISESESEATLKRDRGLPFAEILCCRIRYFTDGALTGSRGFVDEAFAQSRTRFGPR